MSEPNMPDDPRIAAVPDIHGHAKGEHKLYIDERPIPYTARMLFLWFFHACRRGAPRFLMVADHINYLTFEDPAAVNLVRRALKLAQAGDLYGAAETAGVEVNHAAVVGEGLRRGMRYSIGAEVDNDPRSRPDAQNIVDAMRPDGMVRSVHFLTIKHPQFGENWMWPFDNPEFRDMYEVVGTEPMWELYMTTLLDAIDKLPGHIVGHFYVPAKFGHWPSDELLGGYEDRLLEACAARGMAVEINSRYFYKHATANEEQLEKYRTASLRLLRKAKDKGVMVAVGSDAHSPKDQGRGFAEVLALLDQAEINEIAFPIDGRLARVALRATDELRRASALAVREARSEAVPIPGTEELESPRDASAEASAEAVQENDVASTAAPPEAATATAVPATTIKKRPARAKKVASEPPPQAAPLEARVPPVSVADADLVLVIAPASQAPPGIETPSEGRSAAQPEKTSSPGASGEQPAEPELTGVPQAPSHEPEHPVDVAVVPSEVAERPQPAPEFAASAAGSASADAVPEVGEEAGPEPQNAPRPVVTRPAPKRSIKAATKSPVRSKGSAGASKPSSTAKKNATKRTPAKKGGRPGRVTAPAKKVTAKKAPAARKSTVKGSAPKSVSRSSAKKASAKKPAAKKKATKSRR